MYHLSILFKQKEQISHKAQSTQWGGVVVPPHIFCYFSADNDLFCNQGICHNSGIPLGG